MLSSTADPLEEPEYDILAEDGGVEGHVMPTKLQSPGCGLGRRTNEEDVVFDLTEDQVSATARVLQNLVTVDHLTNLLVTAGAEHALEQCEGRGLLFGAHVTEFQAVALENTGREVRPLGG